MVNALRGRAILTPREQLKTHVKRRDNPFHHTHPHREKWLITYFVDTSRRLFKEPKKNKQRARQKILTKYCNQTFLAHFLKMCVGSFKNTYLYPILKDSILDNYIILIFSMYKFRP